VGHRSVGGKAIEKLQWSAPRVLHPGRLNPSLHWTSSLPSAVARDATRTRSANKLSTGHGHVLHACSWALRGGLPGPGASPLSPNGALLCRCNGATVRRTCRRGTSPGMSFEPRIWARELHHDVRYLIVALLGRSHAPDCQNCSPEPLLRRVLRSHVGKVLRNLSAGEKPFHAVRRVLPYVLLL
jgi:hypothetical protein